MNKLSVHNTGKVEPTAKISSQRPGEKSLTSKQGEENTGLKPTDSVELSGKAQQTTDLVDRVKSLPDTRSELVAKFQELFENAEYEPAGELIADAILKEEF